jgi:hypothetical protein
MSISSKLERLNYGSSDGCVAPGQHREVVVVAANTTLTTEQSGALVLLGVASGATVTLPVPPTEGGTQFDFSVSVTRTTNSYKIITSGATVFLLGAYMAGDATIATSGDVFTLDGTSHVALTIDGDTKGGFVGGHLRFTAISATQWYVEGLVIGTGTMATAAATS